MHDPMTVAFNIKSPIKRKGYRNSLITVWHVDPCKDGTDDSCGRFMRARHGNNEVLRRIEGDFDFNWDEEFGGWFKSDSSSRLSVQGIVLNMIFLAAYEHFGKKRDYAMRFCQRNLAEIMLFAENNSDSLFDGITNRYGTEKKKDRIERFAACTYGWVLRAERPWWKDPRWHVHHWKIQLDFLRLFKRRNNGH